jgi:hypothetical protein
VGLPSQTVTFSASSGTLTGAGAVTDASGSASASLIVGADKANRNITIDVTSGSAHGSIVIPVTGSLVTISGESSMRSGGTTTTYTVRAADSAGNPVSGSIVAMTSTLGNTVSPSTQVTDSNGNAKFFYSPSKAGADSLTATGLNAVDVKQLAINSVDFSLVSPADGTVVEVNTDQTISVQYKELGLPVPNMVVNFSTTRGTVVSTVPVTNASGLAIATLSSATSGPAVVSAQIFKGSSLVGQVNLTVQFAASTPATVVVQANPGAVLPNTNGSTANQSTIEAVVRDSVGNTVAGKQVNFSTVSDLSNGSFSSGNATTDLNGRAQVQFIPGAISTPSEGVVIQARVANTDVSSQTTLTVGGNALFINFAYGNTISNLDPTTYSKDFSISVTDANGSAVVGKAVTISAIPDFYYKGYLVWYDALTYWDYAFSPTMCQNEDINRDGVLQFSPINEDINSDGKLWPGNVVVVTPASLVTDSAGRATFKLQYGEQYAKWISLQIVARATVLGTESSKSMGYILEGLSSDYTSKTVAPAGVVSPYGTASDCANPN